MAEIVKSREKWLLDESLNFSRSATPKLGFIPFLCSFCQCFSGFVLF